LQYNFDGYDSDPEGKMTSSLLNFTVSRENRRRMHAAAARAQLQDRGETPVTRVVLRYSSAADDARLRRLAELDSAAPPNGAALVAEIDGRIRAVLPLDGSAPIADPFHRGAELIELLTLRAAQLGRPLSA
jgi:hypothetical protein